jgi:hypothetical protein|tara:strand:- start:619 stop:1218 length:600 start_codon:yes stop_codon:yes gene_type:complete
MFMKSINSEVTFIPHFTPHPEIVFVPEVQLLTFPITDVDADLWEFHLKDYFETYFHGLTPEDKLDYLDLHESEIYDSLKMDILSYFIENKTMKESYENKTTECDDFIDAVVDGLVFTFVGQLRQFQIDRARKIAKGMQEMFALNPDTELEGCEKMLEMSEEVLSDINQDLVPSGSSDVIYWETFRDSFAFAVGQLSMDF